MMSEFAAASATITPLPGWSPPPPLSLLLKLLSLLWPPLPPNGLLEEPELLPDEPPGRGGKPVLPVDEPELLFWLNEFELLPPPEEPDDELSPPPLPSIPRKVLARVAASALRGGTTCMLPGCVVAASSERTSCFAAASREALDARSK